MVVKQDSGKNYIGSAGIGLRSLQTSATTAAGW